MKIEDVKVGDYVKIRLSIDPEKVEAEYIEGIPVVAEKVWCRVSKIQGDTLTVEINNYPTLKPFELGEILEAPIDYVLEKQE